MRQYEVDWQTFEQALPAKGAHIVVEIERKSYPRDNPLRPYVHRSECVTGTFLHLRAIEVIGREWRKAGIKHKGGGVQHVSPSSRWYLAGSERLKVAP